MNSKFEKKNKKNSGKSEIFWGRICLRTQDVNKISFSFGTQGARGKKNKNICLMDSKFKKIKTKSKKSEIVWGPICLHAQGATKILS